MDASDQDRPNTHEGTLNPPHNRVRVERPRVPTLRDPRSGLCFRERGGVEHTLPDLSNTAVGAPLHECQELGAPHLHAKLLSVLGLLPGQDGQSPLGCKHSVGVLLVVDPRHSVIERSLILRRQLLEVDAVDLVLSEPGGSGPVLCGSVRYVELPDRVPEQVALPPRHGRAAPVTQDAL